MVLAQSPFHPVYRPLPTDIPSDQLGNHGIIEHTDLIPLHHTGINTNVFRLLWCSQIAYGTG